MNQLNEPCWMNLSIESVDWMNQTDESIIELKKRKWNWSGFVFKCNIDILFPGLRGVLCCRGVCKYSFVMSSRPPFSVLCPVHRHVWLFPYFYGLCYFLVFRTCVSRRSLWRPCSSWRTRRSRGPGWRQCGCGARPWASASPCATSSCTRPSLPYSSLTRYTPHSLYPSLHSLVSLLPWLILMEMKQKLPRRHCGPTHASHADFIS